MTAERAPATRTVVLERAGRGWQDGYWHQLVGVRVKMPAVIERGRVLVGYLVAVREESPARFVLEFSDLEPEPTEE